MFALVKELGASPTTAHETGTQLLKIVIDILKLGGGNSTRPFQSARLTIPRI
jgi:hypothetical protein